MRYRLASLVLLLAATPALAQRTPRQEFQKLLDDAWEFNLKESPVFATRMGDRRFDDRLSRQTLRDQQRRNQMRNTWLARLNAISREKLTPEWQVHYDIYQRLLEDDLAEFKFQSHLLPITNRSGFHVEFPELPRRVPLETTRDYENYLARLNDFRRYVADHIELMRAGIKSGQVLPAVVLEGYREAIEPHIVANAAESLLYAPFQKFPDKVPAAEHARLRKAAEAAIGESVVAGYRDFLEFMSSEYVPAARGTIAASALPQGREFYRHRVRQFTTLDVTPQQVHELGLAEVKRIRAEMLEVIKQTKFEGDFAAFVEMLRQEPRFYAQTPEQLMKEVAYVLKKMDGQLPKLFGRLPRTPYGIRPVPDYIAPKTTTAYYSVPAGSGKEAGFYYVNTYDLKSRPLFELEALSLHEAVPGHHLQLALQQELPDMPRFRRFNGFTAFVEGWALYAERLGLEVGFYEDPYSNFGRLSYEMWRACRLVVDTGMHDQGWTRQQAIEFMAANTALTMHNIRSEVDRYIAWPGQALAYKTGELKIRELRARAEQELGPRFDIRAFHDVVLGSGSVPLSVLEQNVVAWLAEARQPPASAVKRLSADQVLTRIGFGSCCKQQQPAPLFEKIVETKPQVFLFLGDNIYGDTDDMAVLKKKYGDLAAIPGFARLRQTCPLLATWDDHDYGVNDGGREYPKRVESQQVFNDFWGEPADSPRRKRPGIYDAHVYGPAGKRVQVILLDTRYFRSPLKARDKKPADNIGVYLPNNDPQATVLGEAQWKWLEAQLRVPAEVRIVCSSIQFVSEFSGAEAWANFPQEKQRMLDLIARCQAAGVVFVSGDRHWVELSRMPQPAGYPLYDVTSSAINQTHPRGTPSPNKYRVGKSYHEANFGLILIDWDAAEPLLRLQVLDSAGKLRVDQPVKLSELRGATKGK